MFHIPENKMYIKSNTINLSILSNLNLKPFINRTKPLIIKIKTFRLSMNVPSIRLTGISAINNDKRFFLDT